MIVEFLGTAVIALVVVLAIVAIWHIISDRK